MTLMNYSQVIDLLENYGCTFRNSNNCYVYYNDYVIFLLSYPNTFIVPKLVFDNKYNIFHSTASYYTKNITFTMLEEFNEITTNQIKKLKSMINQKKIFELEKDFYD